LVPNILKPLNYSTLIVEISLTNKDNYFSGPLPIPYSEQFIGPLDGILKQTVNYPIRMGKEKPLTLYARGRKPTMIGKEDT
jgi:hypothetical protein